MTISAPSTSRGANFKTKEAVKATKKKQPTNKSKKNEDMVKIKMGFDKQKKKDN